MLVKSGCNLRAADLNLSGASSDPYVVIEAALALHGKNKNNFEFFFWLGEGR